MPLIAGVYGPLTYNRSDAHEEYAMRITINLRSATANRDPSVSGFFDSPMHRR